ncbi:hypothetical protein B0H14DRAFT_3139855 [Mycena olivaceomarginata]|nr:hypothetical protein B0H14DRAFT_3139855 [Mycena olivaceomarginata]
MTKNFMRKFRKIPREVFPDGPGSGLWRSPPPKYMGHNSQFGREVAVLDAGFEIRGIYGILRPWLKPKPGQAKPWWTEQRSSVYIRETTAKFYNSGQTSTNHLQLPNSAEFGDDDGVWNGLAPEAAGAEGWAGTVGWAGAEGSLDCFGPDPVDASFGLNLHYVLALLFTARHCNWNHGQMHSSGKQPSKTKNLSNRQDQAGLRYCLMDQCFNHHDLKQCGQCRIASYCVRVLTFICFFQSGLNDNVSFKSVTCQRNHWEKHKPLCKYNIAQLKLGGGEQILQRHLRRWVARFEATLIDACICGLNLKYEWERIKEGGLCIFMVPRPHQNQGSRWHIDEARMLSNEDIMDVMEKGGVDDQWTTLLSLHSLERDDLRKSSGGLADFATVIIIGVNGGLHPLKGLERNNGEVGVGRRRRAEYCS